MVKVFCFANVSFFYSPNFGRRAKVTVSPLLPHNGVMSGKEPLL